MFVKLISLDSFTKHKVKELFKFNPFFFNKISITPLKVSTARQVGRLSASQAFRVNLLQFTYIFCSS